MFNLRKKYRKRNDEIQESYENTIARIKEIRNETGRSDVPEEKKEQHRFFNHAANFILDMVGNEKKWDADYFLSKDLLLLKRENSALFSELLPSNYEECYSNPEYSVKLFGMEEGQFFSMFYNLLRRLIFHACMHRIYKIEEINRLIIRLFDFTNGKDCNFAGMKSIIEAHSKKDRTEDITEGLNEGYNPDFTLYLDVLLESDLNSLEYLYLYGKYITDFEILTAQFLQKYPKNKIDKMAEQIVYAYIKGFELKDKDPFKKKNVILIYRVGQEIIAREIVNAIRKKGLTPIIGSPHSTAINRQYGYDHRFDMSLWLDEEFIDIYNKSSKTSYEYCKDILKEYSGVIFLDQFGEKPFKPVEKKENLKLADSQQQLFQVFQNIHMQLREKYMPRSDTSFSVMALPSPEIGDKYEEIFEDILEVNMLESEVYEGIQQNIIDVLDLADYVHVKGQDGSRTDIKVKMQKLDLPEKQTNFVNCGADVNIPVGEVFTSPQLTGTNGILHISETFLNRLLFIDLELIFEDGYVTGYNCGNFDDEETNKKYIEENLLFPHKTLPIGEFAIGTNALAYVIARKHNIMDVLPVLIIEKMGPHFAIGDTCFSHEEDMKIYNPLNGKEITARDNERTLLRKEDFNKAYTNVHTDITLPYEEIGFISAITKDGESIDIIRDGRFVLEGTEELNNPFN